MKHLRPDILKGIVMLMLLAALMAAGACTTTPSTTVAPTTTTPPPSPITPTITNTPTVATYTINVGTSAALGQYLADGNGRTLYWTNLDVPGMSNVSGTVLANWPVFRASSMVVPSALKASDFGTITRTDGTMQTTYKNWPLYFYIGDKAAGDLNGQGLGNKWYVVAPAASAPTGAVTVTPTPTIPVTTNTPTPPTSATPPSTTVTPPTTTTAPATTTPAPTTATPPTTTSNPGGGGVNY